MVNKVYVDRQIFHKCRFQSGRGIYHDLGADGLCAVALERMRIEEEKKPIACTCVIRWKLSSEADGRVDVRYLDNVGEQADMEEVGTPFFGV
jgi:hypothetical protein